MWEGRRGVLSMEKWTTIRYLRSQGKGIRAIARETGASRQAGRRAIAAESEPRYSRKPATETKLEPHHELIRRLYLKKHLIGTRILKEIRKRGYKGGRSILYDYLRTLREPGLSEKASERFETKPGQQGQFDWSPYTVELGGELRKVCVFGLILGFSRRKHYTVALDERQATVFEAIEDGLWHFGGSPQELLVDNARVLVTDAAPEKLRFNDQFLEFCGHYRIEPKACRPYRPRTKGKIENPFRYLEEQFIKGNSWDSLEHMQEELTRFEEEDLDVRVHGTTGERAIDRFTREKNLLTQLPAQRFVGVLTETRKVSFDCLISFHSNRYSVPAAYAGKIVWIRVSKGNRLVIFSSRREILAEHELRPGKGAIVMVPEHYELLRQRQGARGYALLCSHFLARFPDEGKFLQRMVAQHHISPAGPLRELLSLADLYSDDDLRHAFRLAEEHNRYTHIFIRGILESQARPAPQHAPPPSATPLEHSSVQADLRAYQHVLEAVR